MNPGLLLVKTGHPRDHAWINSSHTPQVHMNTAALTGAYMVKRSIHTSVPFPSTNGMLGN